MTLCVIGTKLARKMSVIERIRQIQAEQKQKNAEVGAAKAIELERARSKAEQNWQRAKAIFAESSAERLLQELRDQYPGELRVQEDKWMISLTWSYGCSGSFICIRADINNRILIISGKENFFFRKNQFKDTDAIESAIAKAYLNPDTYDDSWSTN